MQLAGTIAVPAGMFQGVSPIPEAEISMAGATAIAAAQSSASQQSSLYWAISF